MLVGRSDDDIVVCMVWVYLLRCSDGTVYVGHIRQKRLVQVVLVRSPIQRRIDAAPSHELAATVQKLCGVGRLQPRKIRQSLAQQDQLIAFA